MTPVKLPHTTTTSVKVHDKSMVPGTRPQRKHAYIYLWSLLFLMAGCLTTAYSHVMHLKTILSDLIHFVIFDPHLATMTSILRWIGQWVRFSIRYSNFFSSQQVKRNSMCIYTLYETLINTVHKKTFHTKILLDIWRRHFFSDSKIWAHKITYDNRLFARQRVLT